MCPVNEIMTSFEEGAARRLVERRERNERVQFREAVVTVERILPDEHRHVRTAAGHWLLTDFRS